MIRDAGDIVDRYSIAILKLERIGAPESQEESDLFAEGFCTLTHQHPDITLQAYLDKMLIINSMIWDLEAAVRQGALDDNPLEAGMRAIEVRRINAKRISLKNEINTLTSEGVKDVRRDHLSAAE